MKKAVMILSMILIIGSSSQELIGSEIKPVIKHEDVTGVVSGQTGLEWLRIAIEKAAKVIVRDGKMTTAIQEQQTIFVQHYSDMLIKTERIDTYLKEGLDERARSAKGSYAESLVYKGKVYIALKDLPKTEIPARISQNEKEDAIYISGYKMKLKLDTKSKFAQVDDKPIQMDAAPIILGQEYYLPLESVMAVLGREVSFEYNNNQYIIVITPKTILKDIKAIKKIEFFKTKTFDYQEENRKPFLTLTAGSDIKAFSRCINDAIEMTGILDILGFNYIAIVYYKDRTIRFNLNISTSDPSPYAGFYATSEGRADGYLITKEAAKPFLNQFSKYFK